MSHVQIYSEKLVVRAIQSQHGTLTSRDPLLDQHVKTRHLPVLSCSIQISKKSALGLRRYAISYIITLKPSVLMALNNEVGIGLVQCDALGSFRHHLPQAAWGGTRVTHSPSCCCGHLRQHHDPWLCRPPPPAAAPVLANDEVAKPSFPSQSWNQSALRWRKMWIQRLYTAENFPH